MFSLYAEASTRLLDVSSKAAVLGAVALVAALPFRIARVGGGLDALRDDEVLAEALRGPIGVSTAVTALALLVAAVLADRGAPRWAPTACTIVALGGFAIEGHTRTPVRQWWLVGSDVVHLVAAAVWLGGIVALVLAFRARRDARSLAGMVRRFSDVALIAVGVVAATGVTMAWIILPSAGELTSTGFGLALLVKVALVVVVIILGAYNRYRLVPAVESRHDAPDDEPQDAVQVGARRWLGTIVRAELALLVAAVGVTAVMVTRSPLGSTTAAATAATPAVPPAAHEMATATVTLSNDGGTADVSVMPGRVGANAIDIVLRDTEGRIINPYETPVVELSLPAADIGPLRPRVLPLGIGHYQANADLGFAGSWALSIRVRTGEFESVVGSTTVTIE
jgi:copper transport protein